jgi:ketosteroid isomerase-like protein
MCDRDFSAVSSALDANRETYKDHGEVLMAMLTAISTNQFELLPALFTEDAELVIRGFPGIDGSWSGNRAVIEAVERNFKKITEQKTQVVGMMRQGDAMALMIEETGRFREANQPYAVRGIVWITFDGAQMKRVDEYLHTELK